MIESAPEILHSNEYDLRLTNTIRERNKIQMGWKNPDTPLRKGQMIYYNYIKPHMTLEGKTPAEVAGIGVDAQNKWFEIMKASVTKLEGATSR